MKTVQTKKKLLALNVDTLKTIVGGSCSPGPCSKKLA